jgi:predicted nucleotide-binding protein (sugar kinase/HSP70/actin superfamily)
MTGKDSQKFRINAWRGFVVCDYLRKLYRETRPYEIIRGECDLLYSKSLSRLERCIENGGSKLHKVITEIAEDFGKVKISQNKKKPVVAIIGEIFMRDNAYCNGGIANRLENLGLEVMITPFSEWLVYSTYRFARDSRWKNDKKGFIRSKIQGLGQEVIEKSLLRGISKLTETDRNVSLHDMLSLCNPYISKHYDGDPPIALGTAAALYAKGVSGIAAILPFTCMPGSIIASVSDSFRKDHNDIPFINIAYDGQDSVSLETRLQAFAFQVKEYSLTKEPSEIFIQSEAQR